MAFWRLWSRQLRCQGRHLLGFCWALIIANAAAGQEASKETTSRDPFSDAKLWNLRLELTSQEYDAMQPPPAPGFGAPPATPLVPTAPRDPQRGSERNLFGTEFPWAEGKLIGDGITLDKIGVRYAGEITYFVSGQRLKRPLKLEFNRFGNQSWRGLKSLQLHSMPMDPAKAREALSLSVFRQAGVAAPRATFAEVTLHVPGRFENMYLGLYLAIENVDQQFLQDRFGTANGLLMKPFQVRAVDHLGDDWERFQPRYRPEGSATKEQFQRVIDFSRLVHQADDDEFRKQLESYLDVDRFLKFLAVNAIVSNLESSFALGHNYYLYLDPGSNKFVFIPDNFEFSLANFLLMGTSEQLMDLSLWHPYPGENKLVDRVFTLPGVKTKYGKLISELTKTAFSKDSFLHEMERIEALIKEPLLKEKQATEARKEPPVGFGPPGAPAPPQPPDLRTFLAKRTESITSQLQEKSQGYVPVGFGFPPGGGAGGGAGAAAQPTDEKTFRDLVKVANGFEATLFATPPQLGYPVAVATAPNGELFVAVDEQGSIGRTPGGGKVMRCVDRDGDGKADEVSLFAKMDHPRGLIYQDDALWVLHPPFLSVYHDNGNGAADKSEVLITGLTSGMIDERGGDHTTNGIWMGIDGWIYIAVGDYGCPAARGKDGSQITMRGGIARVRPDGTNLEIFVTGLRNPFDIGIDPLLNFFTRDNNDNRSGGWDIRVIHLIQSAYYGYSQHYANFPEEIMPPLGQFGTGSGTGTLFLQDANWPAKYHNVLLTGDWGRNEVYRHELREHGATFDLQQEVFLSLPRPTGIDLDSHGRLYVASWRNGEASTYVGPNVGFIARISPQGLQSAPPVKLHDAAVPQLMDQLSGPNAVARLQAQRELLRRGRSRDISVALNSLAVDTAAPLEGRVAAMFALKQLNGRTARPVLLKLIEDRSVREFALRALTDRKDELEGIDVRPFVAALSDESPRVRAQALISLGRLNNAGVAKAILPLTIRPRDSVMPAKFPVHAQPDADRVLPHLAVQTLVSLRATAECVDALDGPHASGAFWALRLLHDRKSIDGLIQRLETTQANDMRYEILTSLVRLAQRDTEYHGNWWGIRPENSGPYFDPVDWEETPRIKEVLKRSLQDADSETATFVRRELARHRFTLEGASDMVPSAVATEPESPIAVRQADPQNPNQIGNLAYDDVVRRTLQKMGEAGRGKVLFKAQSCAACHTDADGQPLKGPHLVGIAKRYNSRELIESILKPSNKIAQGFESYIFELSDGRVFTGFVVSQAGKTIAIRESNGVPRVLKLADIETKTIQKQSNMPEGIVGDLTPEELADLITYLQSLNAVTQ